MLNKDEVIALIREGKSYADIGSMLGRSRERIRQIAVSCGVDELARNVKKARSYEKREARSILCSRHQISLALLKELQRNGATLAYARQKQNAKRRGIEWRFTLGSWWLVWESSGKWGLRGRGDGRFVMARIGDVGAYEPSNVYICTHNENSQEMQFIRKQLIDGQN